MSLVRINRTPSSRDLRVFATLWLVFGLGLAGLLAGRGLSGWALISMALALSFGVVGLAAPGSIRWLYLGATYAAFPIGFVVSHLVLGVVYFLVITPVGFCLRLARYDPLHRRREPTRPSYWTPRDTKKPASSYFRQH